MKYYKLIPLIFIIFFVLSSPLCTTNTFSFQLQNDEPPHPPKISGPTHTMTFTATKYNFTVFDPQDRFIIGLEIDYEVDIIIIDCCPIPSGGKIGLFLGWDKPGTYEIKAKAKADRGMWSNWSEPFTVTVNDSDLLDPTIKIIHPTKGIYVNGEKKNNFITPVIFGPINIQIEASDDKSGIKFVELYLEDELQNRFVSPPYTWNWTTPGFGKFSLMVKAQDFSGKQTIKEIAVWKFF